MKNEIKEPKTLQEAICYFSDLDNCISYLANKRWPDGKVTCPTCGSDQVHYLSTRRLWQCVNEHKRRQFSIKVGTIMEDSAIGLDKWLTAIWMVTNDKNGISSYEIHRCLGVTQKSAWFMGHRIRMTLQDTDKGKLSGHVEADETFIGGKARFMHKNKRAKVLWGGSNKTVVAGVLQRDGKVRTEIIPNRSSATLHALVRDNVEPGATLSRMISRATGVCTNDYVHQIVDHAETYVDGQVSTNKIENFWSLVKRQLHGTYISVEPFHLFRYLDEQIFRYNNRATKRHHISDSDRFQLAVSQLANKRLTYNTLIARDLSGQP